MIITGVVWVCMSLTFAQHPNTNEIVFTVPLRLENLHQNVNKVKVVCFVTKMDGTKVGEGEMEINVPSDGNLIRTVTIKAKSIEGRDIYTGVNWYCHFELGASSLNGFFLPVTPQHNTPDTPIELYVMANPAPVCALNGVLTN